MLLVALLLLSFFSFSVKSVSVPTYPQVYFLNEKLTNNSYVDISRVGEHSSGSNSVQCRTDLVTCCSVMQGEHRGDWFFPNRTRIGFEQFSDTYESRGAQRVDLRRRGSQVRGIYRCDIPTSNGTGRQSIYVGLYSNRGEVEVQKSVKFDTEKRTLTCISTGGPATTVIWTRDSTKVTEGYVTVLNDALTAKYTHTLTVTKAGEYKCTVYNNKPSTSSSDPITITGTKAPSGVTAVQTTPTSIHVTWNPSSNATGYILHYNTSTGHNSTVIVSGGSTNNYTFSDLQSRDNYTIFIVATSDNLPSDKIRASDDVRLVGCPDGPDEVWGILWPITAAQTESSQSCPYGAIGNVTRECTVDGSWGRANVMLCRSAEIVRVQEKAKCLEDAETEEERIECAANISEYLAKATERGQTTSLYPLDLNSTNDIIARVLNVLNEDEGKEVSAGDHEALVDVFNNVISEGNQAGWTELQTVGSGSQTLLQNAERFGRVLASKIHDNDGNDALLLSRENIAVAAEVVKDPSNILVFPAQPDKLGNLSTDTNETVQVKIPQESLKKFGTEAGVYLVNVVFRHIEDILPINTSLLSNTQTESLVISTQLGTQDESGSLDFSEYPITFNFSFKASSEEGSKYTGVFWDFADIVGSGEWSSEGIQVISSDTTDNVTTVVFTSTHLTSFAVLVDVAGGLEGASEEETLALKFVSYIGCGVSTVCLFITVLFYLAMGKKLFSAIHYFVHLNLALTLLLGYLVFVLGIELGKSNKIVCGFVAALLQYLFLAAFCWMMCEGIMLYLMLIVVFSRLSKKWWFFLIIGYGTPLLFVAGGLAARFEHYGVYGKDGELAFCWLSTEKGTIFAFVAPMILIILVNTVFLVLSVSALLHSTQKAGVLERKKSLHKAKTILKATVILLPLLGVTWLFGLLTLNSSTTVFAWLFTIFNSLQGAAIFFFHVIRSKPVWSKIMYIFKKTTPVSSTKYTLSSTSESQSSAEALKSVLHKKPLDMRENGSEPYTSYSVMSGSQSPSDGDEQESDIDKKSLMILGKK